LHGDGIIAQRHYFGSVFFVKGAAITFPRSGGTSREPLEEDKRPEPIDESGEEEFVHGNYQWGIIMLGGCKVRQVCFPFILPGCIV
jgi:hypothetical protein